MYISNVYFERIFIRKNTKIAARYARLLISSVKWTWKWSAYRYVKIIQLWKFKHLSKLHVTSIRHTCPFWDLWQEQYSEKCVRYFFNLCFKNWINRIYYSIRYKLCIYIYISNGYLLFTVVYGHSERPTHNKKLFFRLIKVHSNKNVIWYIFNIVLVYNICILFWILFVRLRVKFFTTKRIKQLRRKKSSSWQREFRFYWIQDTL